MKNIISLISLVILITSCENEPVVYPIGKNKYKVALDTLKNYNDYILGDFDGKFLISTNVFTKGSGAFYTNDGITDSSRIDFNIGYKILENNMEKSAFVTFYFLEANSKLDTANDYKYKHFSDFVDFFDRNQLVYKQIRHPKLTDNLHSIRIIYMYHNIFNDEDIYTYNSEDYMPQIKPEYFNFYIDSIKCY